MGEHNYQNPSYHKLTIDGIEVTSYDLHSVFRVKRVDLLDKVIVNAIVNAARENGITDVYLIDKEFILSAIKNELERMKEK